MYLLTFNVSAYNFKLVSYFFSNGDGIHVYNITIWTIVMCVQSLLNILVKKGDMASQYPKVI